MSAVCCLAARPPTYPRGPLRSHQAAAFVHVSCLPLLLAYPLSSTRHEQLLTCCSSWHARAVKAEPDLCTFQTFSNARPFDLDMFMHAIVLPQHCGEASQPWRSIHLPCLVSPPRRVTLSTPILGYPVSLWPPSSSSHLRAATPTHAVSACFCRPDRLDLFLDLQTFTHAVRLLSSLFLPGGPCS